METLVLFVNMFFVWYCWDRARFDFAESKNFYGWVYIFLSALNATAVALNIV